jgi:uncharacterized RDD family membrane protein YckC
MSSTPANVLAGLGRRIHAAVWDLIIMCLALMARDALMKGSGPVELGVLVGIPVAYFVIFPVTGLQGTLGMRLAGIKVADFSGAPIGLIASIVRFVVSLLVPLTAGLTLILAQWTPRRQALHDLIARTVVVRSRATPAEISWAVAEPSWPWRIVGLVVVAAVAGCAFYAFQTYDLAKIDWKCAVEKVTSLDQLVGCRR